MRWLQDVEGPIEQFNQTMVVQAPAGVTEADVVVVLQALLDRHAMLRLRVDDERRRGLVASGARGGFGRARRVACKRWTTLSDEALVGARARLNPAAGAMLSALWVTSTVPVGVDHSPPGRRRCVVANPVGGPQH